MSLPFDDDEAPSPRAFTPAPRAVSPRDLTPAPQSPPASPRSPTLGRIALKQVPAARESAQPPAPPSTNGGRPADPATAAANPANRLVPYLDLFARLEDDELARLARVESPVVAELRRQVAEVSQALARYVDLLGRLDDEELVRLTGAPAKTVRFWRLCQPRRGKGGAEPSAQSSTRMERDKVVAGAGTVDRTPTGPVSPVAAPPVDDDDDFDAFIKVE